MRQNLNMSRDSYIFLSGLPITHTLIIITISLNTEFEMPVFTGFRDTIGVPKFKNGSRDSDHAHLGVVYHAKGAKRSDGVTENNKIAVYVVELYKQQGVVLTGRNTTGLPSCAVPW